MLDFVLQFYYIRIMNEYNAPTTMRFTDDMKEKLTEACSTLEIDKTAVMKMAFNWWYDNIFYKIKNNVKK